MNEKKRLDLTIRNDFKQKASELARLRRRSISGLFEDLIEKEDQRIDRIRGGGGPKQKT